MISIGGRKVLLSETLLCPADEKIALSIEVPGEEEPWKLEIIFSEDESKKEDKERPKPTMDWIVENDIWILNFRNWSNSFGAVISTPAEIAVSLGGLTITLLAEVAKLTGLYRAKLQFMIEERKND